jgi:hypothetical protein
MYKHSCQCADPGETVRLAFIRQDFTGHPKSHVELALAIVMRNLSTHWCVCCVDLRGTRQLSFSGAGNPGPRVTVHAGTRRYKWSSRTSEFPSQVFCAAFPVPMARPTISSLTNSVLMAMFSVGLHSVAAGTHRKASIESGLTCSTCAKLSTSNSGIQAFDHAISLE